MLSDIDEIHKKILDQIDDQYQKTVGFPTYDITRGIAFGEQKLWQKAKEIQDKQDVENLVGDELDLFIRERTGLRRKEAKYAHGFIDIVTGAGTVMEGSLFESDGGLQYMSMESKKVIAGDEVAIQCVTAGIAGNVAAYSINAMPITLPGIAMVTNNEALEGGTEKETDDSYRERYYVYLSTEATCGNVAHYLQWAREIPGVGAAVCFPLWAGDNTVKVVIINDEHEPASEEIVDEVQAHIDPGKTGRGDGTAPVGAYCTVISAEPIPVDITVTVTLLKGHDNKEVTKNIREEIKNYLYSIAFQQNFISYAKVGAAVIGTDGVADYSHLEINGKVGNVSTIDFNYVAVLGQVQLNVME